MPATAAVANVVIPAIPCTRLQPHNDPRALHCRRYRTDFVGPTTEVSAVEVKVVPAAPSPSQQPCSAASADPIASRVTAAATSSATPHVVRVVVRRRSQSADPLQQRIFAVDQLEERRAKTSLPDHVRGNPARLGEPQAPAQEGQDGVRVQVLQPDVQQTLFAAHTRAQSHAVGQLPVRDVLQVVQAAGQPATTQVSVEIALNLILQ